MTAETGQFHPPRAWWERLFAVIDAGDAEGFARFFSPDGRFRFGNAPEVIGTVAIRTVAANFFGAIARCRHELGRTWEGAGSAVCEGRVTYTRRDGTLLEVPFVDVLDFSGELVASYRIYVDISDLFVTRGAHGEVLGDSAAPKR